MEGLHASTNPLSAASPDSPDRDTFLQEASILNLKMSFLEAQGTTLPLTLYLSKNVIPTQGESFALQERSNHPLSPASIFMGIVHALTCSPCGMSAWEPG